jgi:Tfp pilus assembly protein PilV
MKKLVNQKGISLLEVLIGMFILAIGLLGLAPMFTLAVEGNVISRDNSEAATLVKEKLEYYASLETFPSLPYKEYETGLDNLYTRATFIADNTVDTLIPDGVYKVDVVVAWVDHQSVNRSTMYSTYLVKD